MKYLLMFSTLVITRLIYASNSIFFLTDARTTCSGIPIAKDTFYTMKHCVPDEATRVIVLMPSEGSELVRYDSEIERIVNPEHESKKDYPLKIKIKYDAFTDIFPIDGNARARRYEVHCTLFKFTDISRAKIVVENVDFNDVITSDEADEADETDVITSEASAVVPGCSGGGLFAMTVDGPVLVALVRQLTYSSFRILRRRIRVYKKVIYEEVEGDENRPTDYDDRGP